MLYELSVGLDGNISFIISFIISFYILFITTFKEKKKKEGHRFHLLILSCTQYTLSSFYIVFIPVFFIFLWFVHFGATRTSPHSRGAHGVVASGHSPTLT